MSSVLPAQGRLRPAHVSGICAHIDPPSFTIEYKRDYRDYFGPVCVGEVSSDSSGSRVTARIPRSRESWFIPGLILLVAVFGWVRSGGPRIREVIILIVALPLVVGWSLLLSLFSMPKYEAEADGLDAMLRRAIERAEGGPAVA